MRPTVLVLVVLAGPGLVQAQAQAAGDQEADRGYAEWMTAWSPFRVIADLAQTPPAARPLALVAVPAPRVGLWWTAGVPAALSFELSDERSAFRAGVARTSGLYRRAMDSREVTVIQASALAWRPIAASGGVAGSVIVDQELTGARPYATTLLPYSSDPFVVADTTAPGTRRVRARVEGAFGWRVGPVGAGISAGLEEDDHRTRDAGFPHFGRTATPAVRAGISYVPHPAIRVAVYGRWIRGTETLSMVPRSATGLVLRLAGYHEPDSAAVAGPAFFFRRSERSARAAGGALAGRALGIDWVAYAERAIRHNRHFSAQILDPPTDRWDADGWVMGGAVQRWLGDRLLATGHIRRTTLEGDAQLATLEGVIFRVRESELAISGELRYAPAGSLWTAAARYHVTRSHRLRYDYIAEVGSDLVEWTPSVAVAASRRVGRATLGVGVSGAAHTAAGGIPDADAMGPVYQTLVAPGLSLAATRARPVIGSLSLGHQVGTGLTIVLDAQYATLGRVEPAAAPSFTPDGRRSTWSVSVRVVRLR
jgi:hypothetical protein